MWRKSEADAPPSEGGHNVSLASIVLELFFGRPRALLLVVVVVVGDGAAQATVRAAKLR